jgi:hypothetical protein
MSKHGNRIPKPGRRWFLGEVGAATLTLRAVGLGQVLDPRKAVAEERERRSGGRRGQANDLREDMAETNLKNTPADLDHPSNGDEALYPNKIATYTKGLRQKANGEVDLGSYHSMIAALVSGSPSEFGEIEIGGDRGLTNPQSGLAFEMEGGDSQSFVQPPAPRFASREEAAEIAENYWMALLRDVPFSQYASNPIAHAAAADLTLFGADAKVAKNSGGAVTSDLLFRGLTPGDKTGPYLSQFFYQQCNFGATSVDQKVRTALPGDFMTSFDSGPGNWLDVQRGITPPQHIDMDSILRYMRNGRDIGQWVHMDVLFQAYFQALLVLFGINAPNDAANPYNSDPTQIGFGTFGPPHISALMCEVATRALHAVWYQKWFVHRRLRPEVFAERVDRTLNHGASYPVHHEILNDLASATRLGGYLPHGNALLPMAFPEGSPTHPSYGAGHATVGGACTTVLKAWFDESHVIPDPVMPAEDGLSLLTYTGPSLTVGNELNKLASNVALGRNIAGVHWRSDATESLLLGESVAIQLLREQKVCFNENFNGFSVTKFDGTTVTI